MVAGLAFVNWRATLVVFVVPFVVTRFAMMAGNWGQHAFIDAASPENCYRNSITCINSGYNRRCFNDGYHIGHHIKQTRHWTEMPEDFLDNVAKYDAERAIVFDRLDFFGVWVLPHARALRLAGEAVRAARRGPAAVRRGDRSGSCGRARRASARVPPQRPSRSRHRLSSEEAPWRR